MSGMRGGVVSESEATRRIVRVLNICWETELITPDKSGKKKKIQRVSLSTRSDLNTNDEPHVKATHGSEPVISSCSRTNDKSKRSCARSLGPQLQHDCSPE